ncbi:hypothetical protein Tco_1261563 [Tanacetum coccineum]
MKMQSGKIKVIKCSLMVLSGTKRDCVYTLDGQRSTQQYTKSNVAKHLGVVGIQQNGLVEETNVTLLAKVTIISDGFKTPTDMLGVFCWLASIKQGMLEPVKVKNMGFNKSREYKKTFIGSGVEVQTQDLIYYHSTRDKEQHSAWELFSYKEDSNEAAFAVATLDKIYAHE